MMMPGNGLITLAGPRIQKKRRPKRAPFLLRPRLADGLQAEQVLLAELEGTAFPREGHDPLKHKSSQMYRYLENDNLAPGRATVRIVCTPVAGRYPSIFGSFQDADHTIATSWLFMFPAMGTRSTGNTIVRQQFD
jgi:hypothetical protein